VTPAGRLAALGTATVAEALSTARVLDPAPRPLSPEMRLAGPARTVRCPPGDNLALHLAIAAAQLGDVIVVDYGGSLASGPFGEIMALACQMRGIAGLVTDGAVRDSQQIAALGFPVFARGLNIRGTVKADPGETNVPVKLCGTVVHPGDMVLADADGVIVVPVGQVQTALAEAEARAAREAQMIERLRAGETTLQILGLTSREKS
jgi:4-hydroxy-4-methyl-2-oxoglutarate aldolase